MFFWKKENKIKEKQTRLPEISSININGIDFQIKIERIKKRHSSAFFRNNEIIIRLPHRIDAKQESKAKQKLLEWARKNILKNFETIKQNKENELLFENGGKISVLGKEIDLQVQKNSKRNLFKLIEMQNNLENKSKLILIAKCFDKVNKKKLMFFLRKKFEKTFIEKVHLINENHFHEKINEIKIGFASKRLGSCNKAKRKLMFSVNLFLIPEIAINYVIAHELEHLSQANHSKFFWSELEQKFPACKQGKAWLKSNKASLF